MRIAIYSRKSKFTGKGDSIANQIEVCKEYINYNFKDENVELSIFEDEGYSGKNTSRPQFKLMMELQKANKFDCIVVYRLDRISRNAGDFSIIYKELYDNGTNFVSVSEKFDTTNAMGVAMMQISSIFAQLERDIIAERIRTNMYMLAKTGRWLGGICPTGYTSKKIINSSLEKERTLFKLEENLEESKTVKVIFEKFIETASLTKTLQFLSQNNYFSKNGKDFSISTLKDILINPVYCSADEKAYKFFEEKNCQLSFDKNEATSNCGIMPYNRKPTKSKYQVKTNPEEWIIALGKHSPLISSEDWIKAQTILENSDGILPYRRIHNPTSIFSGLIYCKNCGRKMRPRTNSKRKADGTQNFYYMCEYKEKTKSKNCAVANAPGQVLDALICEQLIDFDKDNSFVKSALEQLKKQIPDTKNDYENERNRLLKLIQQKETEIDNYGKMFGKAMVDTPTFKIIENNINTETENLQKLKISLAEIEKKIVDSAFDNKIYNNLVQTFHTFRNTFETLTVVEKREYVRKIVQKIEWDGENAYIFIFGAT